MDSSASRSSDDDTTKSDDDTTKSDDDTTKSVGDTTKSDADKAGGQEQPSFIGYDEEYDRTIRESAKQDLIESDALQSVLFKIWRGEFDKLKPNGEKSSADPEESEARGEEIDIEETDTEETHVEED